MSNRSGVKGIIDQMYRGITGTFAVINELAKDAAHTAATALDTFVPGDISETIIPRLDNTFFPTHTVNVGADLEQPITEVKSDPIVDNTLTGVHRNLYDIQEHSDPKDVKVPDDKDTLYPTIRPIERPFIDIDRNLTLYDSSVDNRTYDHSYNINNYDASQKIYNYIYNTFDAASGASLEGRSREAVDYGNFYADIDPVYQLIASDRKWSSLKESKEDTRHSILPHYTYVHNLIKGGSNYGKGKDRKKKR